MLGKKKKAADQPPVLEDEVADKKGKANAEDGDGEEVTDAEPPKKSKKKLIIIAALVLISGAAAAGLYFSGMLSKHQEKEVQIMGPDGKPIEKPIYYSLPEFLVNLNSQGKSASFLKATVVLEVAHQTDVPLIEANLPRVIDAFNTYLRELRSSDLAGSAGIQRLREELLLRVNKAVAPVKVNDVLFKEIVVQ